MIESLAAGDNDWGFALASAVEYWSIVTRPLRGPAAATPSEADGYLSELYTAGAHLWLPLPGFGRWLFERAAGEEISGRRIFDWQIGLTALQNGATELWTHDRSFRAPEGLRVVDPLD